MYSYTKMGIRDKVVTGLKKVGKAINLENVRRGIGYGNSALGVVRVLQNTSHPGISRTARKIPVEDLQGILGVASKVHTVIDRANRAPGIPDPSYHLGSNRVHIFNPTVFDEDRMARSIAHAMH